MSATHFSGPVISLNGFQATAGYMIESNVYGVTAGTTRTQAGATLITSEITRVDTSTAVTAPATLGDGIILPVSQAGMELWIWNNTNNPVQMYAQGTDTINGIAGATGVVMPPNSVYATICGAAGSWAVDGIGAGAVGNFPTVTTVDQLVAHAGGGQGSATPLVAQINRVVTVATAADSVILPAAKAGLQVVAVNAATTNSMNVFPNTGDIINALAANTAFAVAAGKTCQFFSTSNGQWHALLSA